MNKTDHDINLMADADQVHAQTLKEVVRALTDPSKLPFLGRIPKKYFDRDLERHQIMLLFPTPGMVKLQYTRYTFYCALDGWRINQILDVIKAMFNYKNEVRKAYLDSFKEKFKDEK